MELNGAQTTIRAGDVLTMNLTPMTNPVTGEIHEATVQLPTGFISTAMHRATTSEFFVHDGINYAYPGKDSGWGRFDYSGPS